MTAKIMAKINYNLKNYNYGLVCHNFNLCQFRLFNLIIMAVYVHDFFFMWQKWAPLNHAQMSGKWVEMTVITHFSQKGPCMKQKVDSGHWNFVFAVLQIKCNITEHKHLIMCSVLSIFDWMSFLDLTWLRWIKTLISY